MLRNICITPTILRRFARCSCPSFYYWMRSCIWTQWWVIKVLVRHHYASNPFLNKFIESVNWLKPYQGIYFSSFCLLRIILRALNIGLFLWTQSHHSIWVQHQGDYRVDLFSRLFVYILARRITKNWVCISIIFWVGNTTLNIYLLFFIILELQSSPLGFCYIGPTHI